MESVHNQLSSEIGDQEKLIDNLYSKEISRLSNATKRIDVGYEDVSIDGVEGLIFKIKNDVDIISNIEIWCRLRHATSGFIKCVVMDELPTNINDNAYFNNYKYTSVIELVNGVNIAQDGNKAYKFNFEFDNLTFNTDYIYVAVFTHGGNDTIYMGVRKSTEDIFNESTLEVETIKNLNIVSKKWDDETNSRNTVVTLNGYKRVKPTSDKNLWKGKKCTILGTSLTANGGWSDVLKERFEFEKMYNRGLGGTTLVNMSSYGLTNYWTTTPVYSDTSLYDEDKDTVFYNSSNPISGATTKNIKTWYCSQDRIDLVPQDSDLVLIDIGINDHSRARDMTSEQKKTWLGEFHQKSQWQESQSALQFDESKFSDAFCVMIKRIQTRCPDAKIVVWGMPYNVNIISVSSDGVTHVDYYDIFNSMIAKLEEMCRNMGVEYINMYSECGVNVWNVMSYFEDGIHPYKPTYNSEKGKYAVANVLTRHLRGIYPKDYMMI